MSAPVTNFNSIIDLLEKFPDEQSCIEHLERIRWNDNILSPFDADSKVYKCKNNRYRCKNTGKYFNVRTGTIYEGTKIPLRKWFMALYLISSLKKGISSHQISRDLKVTQKTAWFMLHRIRYTFGHEMFQAEMDGVIQSDEAFIGGKNRFRHSNKKVKYTQDKIYEDKATVMGLESNGMVRAFVIPDTTKHSLHYHLFKNVGEGNVIVTDEWKGYRGLKGYYHHETVDHSGGQYLNDCGFTTNCIEGFWTHMKKSLIGIYHNTSKRLLQRYIDESVFRFNTRSLSESERFNLYISSIEMRLKYKDLINSN